MNMLDLMNKLTKLSEAVKDTGKGKIHTADPGGYGRKEDEPEAGETKKKAAPRDGAPRGRGRPKKGADDSGSTTSYDFTAFGAPAKGKEIKLPKWDKSKTTKHTPMKDSEKAEKKKEKSSLKDWINRVDKALNESSAEMAEASGSAPWASNFKKAQLASKAAQQSPGKASHSKAAALHREGAKDPWGPYKDDHIAAAEKHEKSMKMYNEADRSGMNRSRVEEDDQIQIKPASQMPKTLGQPTTPGQTSSTGATSPDTQVIAQGSKTLATVKNPALAQQIKQSIGKGEMSLNLDKQMAEAKKIKETSTINGKVEDPKSLKWKQTSMSPAAATAKYGKANVKVTKGGLRNGSDMVEVNVPLGEAKKAKPDFLDVDKDKNKKEPFKKAVKDAEKVEEGSTGDYSAKKAAAGKDIGKPGKQFSKIASGAAAKYGSKESGAKVAGAVLKNLRSKVKEGDVPPTDSMMSPISESKVKELSMDLTDLTDAEFKAKYKMSKADMKKKSKLAEGAQPSQAAHHRGKAHAMGGESYNCRYDEGSDQARMYHEGYKEGLDECYGQTPIQGMTSNRNEFDMDEGNAFTGALTRTPHGGQFSLGKDSFTDTSGYDSPLDEIAFESLDNQLTALLEGISEGMNVSISQKQEGAPDSVSINATDAEAAELLSFVKSAGLGIFGGDDAGQQGGMQQPDNGNGQALGNLEVVDDHDGMMSLIKKMTGGSSSGSQDYADEQGQEEQGQPQGQEEACESCGESACGCSGGKENLVGETETDDQRAYEVAEEEEPEEDEEEESHDDSSSDNDYKYDIAKQAELDAKDDVDESSEEEDEYDAQGRLKTGGGYDAGGHQTSKGAENAADKADYEKVDEDDEEDEEDEDLEESYANSADDTFEADINYMTRIVSGGLNKEKSTGQTTTPVVASQASRLGNPMRESTSLLQDWKTLSGIR